MLFADSRPFEAHMEPYGRMERALQVAVVGDRQPGKETHVATDAALQHSAKVLGLPFATRWLPTDDMPTDDVLASFDAFLCAPGSPYRDRESALRAIRVAREHDVPFLGTCGGFQHAVIEFARNVAGVADADHEEYDAASGVMVVSALSCSLFGQTLPIRVDQPSLAWDVYGAANVDEKHFCSFGLNPAYEQVLASAGMRISGRGDDSEPRIIELPDHRFHLATLFVPQASSTIDEPHPVVTGLLEAARARHAARMSG